jgi:hypothetical protein
MIESADTKCKISWDCKGFNKVRQRYSGTALAYKPFEYQEQVSISIEGDCLHVDESNHVL